MSIGMAKPMFWACPATAVLIPMTLPLGSSSGPPLLPGLIAVSVWMRLLSWLPLSTGMLRPTAEMIPLVTESVNVAERAADRDRGLADLDGRRVADRGGRQAGRLDLDDRQVGQRVDAVDGCVELAPVVEVDGEARRIALDHVVVGEDEAVRVEDHAGAGSGPLGALGDDRDDRRADGLGDVDDRALATGRGGRVGDGWIDHRVRIPDWWLPAALTARYVPPDDRTAAPMTAARTKPGPTVRLALEPALAVETGALPPNGAVGVGFALGLAGVQAGVLALQVGLDQAGGEVGGFVPGVAAQSSRETGVSSFMDRDPLPPRCSRQTRSLVGAIGSNVAVPRERATRKSVKVPAPLRFLNPPVRSGSRGSRRRRRAAQSVRASASAGQFPRPKARLTADRLDGGRRNQIGDTTRRLTTRDARCSPRRADFGAVWANDRSDWVIRNQASSKVRSSPADVR